MPASHGVNDALIVKAVREGRLDEAVLDKAVERILNIVYRFVENRDETAVFDRDKDHEMARKVAEESIVLLKMMASFRFPKQTRSRSSVNLQRSRDSRVAAAATSIPIR